MVATIAVIIFAAAVAAAQIGEPAAVHASVPDTDRLERVALATARTELLRRVLGLAIDNERTLGDWLASDVPRDRVVRRWIRSMPTGAVETKDGAAHVSLSLSPVAIRDRLLALAAEPTRTTTPGAAGRAVDWHAAAARWSEISVSASVSSDAGIGEAPQGWEDVSADDRALARRAAEADARGELLHAAAGLRVTSARLLGDFLDSSDEVRRCVLDGIDRRASATTRFEPDQVAVAEARIALGELIDVLLDAHQRYYNGVIFRREHFREMAVIVRQTEVKATGYATPPMPLRVEASLPDIREIEPTPDTAVAKTESESDTPPVDAVVAPAAAEPGLPDVAPEAVEQPTSRAVEPEPMTVAHAAPPATSRPTSAARGATDVKSAEVRPENRPRSSGERPRTAATQPARPAAGTAAASGAKSMKSAPSEPPIAGAPPWAGRTLRVVGRAPPSNDEKLTRQAASQAAMRSLRDQILELEVESDLTIGAVLGYRTDIQASFESVIAEARPSGQPVRRVDGSMEVTVELPLKRVWQLFESEAPSDYATDRDLALESPIAQPQTTRPAAP